MQSTRFDARRAARHCSQVLQSTHCANARLGRTLTGSRCISAGAEPYIQGHVCGSFFLHVMNHHPPSWIIIHQFHKPSAARDGAPSWIIIAYAWTFPRKCQKFFPPPPGIEPGSSAWQAEILTTILQRMMTIQWTWNVYTWSMAKNFCCTEKSIKRHI